MELKIKPYYQKVLVTNFITLTFFLILIGTSLALLIENLTIKIISLIFIFSIYLYNLIVSVGSAKNTNYSINNTYISSKKKFISESNSDVPISQITNIDYSISWLWDKIFNTGSIIIYTAGSVNSDLILNNIQKTTNVYEKIQDLLDTHKNANIKSEKIIISKLIEKVKPSAGFAALISTPFIFFLGIYFYGIEDIFESLSSIVGITIAPLLLILIGLFIVITVPAFTYLAYKKKTYNFFTDKLEYYDGFLTLKKSTIPNERITNITEVRTFIDRIFGFSTIGVETAGSVGPEVTIQHVADGEKIVARLKKELKQTGRN
jgi:membrane protein YdbS with pleckstrin-like domain